MSSFIHYKFKSAKDFDTYRFEGAGVPVWELKQEIVAAKKLGKGLDFDLVIINAQTNEEYSNESFIVPKNTSVLVKRVPVIKSKMPSSFGGPKAADPRAEPQQQPLQPAISSNFSEYFPSRPNAAALNYSAAGVGAGGEAVGGGEDEDARIEAMMSANSAVWTQNQQNIGTEFRPRAYKPSFRPPMAAQQPSLPPPPYYVCFRCGQKDHYIAHCPTNSDPTFDKPKLKKSTGIPRSFLKTVAGTDETGSGGVLVTPDGSLVVAMSNDQEWQKISASANRPLVNAEKVPEDLKCTICKGLMNEPVCCPGCKIAYCEECIMRTGTLKQLSCPSCHAAFMAEQLMPSTELKKKIGDFIVSQTSEGKTSDAPAAMPIPPFPLFPGFMPPLPFPLPPFIPPPPTLAVPPPSAPSTETAGSKDDRAEKRRRPSRSRSRSPDHRRTKSRSPRRSSRR